MKEIDCRKLNCPEPVLRTRQALEESEAERVTVLVDNPTARENVVRFIKNRDFALTVEERGDHYAIMICGSGSNPQTPAGSSRPVHRCLPAKTWSW